MVYYECFRCGYNTKQKTHFINHLNRKNICKAIEDDVEINAIKDYYGFENTDEITPKHSKITPNNSKIPPNHSKRIPPKSLQITPKSLQNPSK